MDIPAVPHITESEGEDSSSLAECYICQQPIEDDAEIVRPCACTFPKHKKCLVQWINRERRTNCEICHEQYNYYVRYKTESLCGTYIRIFLSTCWTMFMVIGTLLLPIGEDGWNQIVHSSVWGIFWFMMLISIIFLVCLLYIVKTQLQRLTASSPDHKTEWQLVLSTTAFISVNLSLLIGMMVRSYLYNHKRVRYLQSLNFIYGIVTVIIITPIIVALLCIVATIVGLCKYDYHQGFRDCFYRYRTVRVLTDLQQADPESVELVSV